MSKIVKTLIFGGDISLAAIDSTEAVREGASRHRMTSSAAAAFGRAFTLTAYLCSWLKERGSLSVAIDGGGACGKISVTGTAQLALCGYAEHADAEGDVRACVGNAGTLTVVRCEPDCLPFTGTSELVSGNLNDDFSRYFSVSEQRETLICAGERFSEAGRLLFAGGLILQAMPFADKRSLFSARELAEKFCDFPSGCAEKDVESFVKEISPEGQISARKIIFRCHCSRERAENAVRSLGRTGAEELLREEGEITVHCHDCNTDYTFGEREVAELFRSGE